MPLGVKGPRAAWISVLSAQPIPQKNHTLRRSSASRSAIPTDTSRIHQPDRPDLTDRFNTLCAGGVGR
jgi:hypothetical protein